MVQTAPSVDADAPVARDDTRVRKDVTEVDTHTDAPVLVREVDTDSVRVREVDNDAVRGREIDTDHRSYAVHTLVEDMWTVD